MSREDISWTSPSSAASMRALIRFISASQLEYICTYTCIWNHLSIFIYMHMETTSSAASIKALIRFMSASQLEYIHTYMYIQNHLSIFIHMHIETPSSAASIRKLIEAERRNSTGTEQDITKKQKTGHFGWIITNQISDTLNEHQCLQTPMSRALLEYFVTRGNKP